MAAALGLARATDTLNMQRRFEKDASRGIRAGAGELRAQAKAYGDAAGQSEQARAEETAQELLRELEEIERGLREREKTAGA